MTFFGLRGVAFLLAHRAMCLLFNVMKFPVPELAQTPDYCVNINTKEWSQQLRPFGHGDTQHRYTWIGKLCVNIGFCLVVSYCLSALRQTLPRDAAMMIYSRWYSQRNLPASCQLEWRQFASCLLGILGYDSAGASRPVTALSHLPAETVVPSLQTKKPRLSENGSDAVANINIDLGVFF